MEQAAHLDSEPKRATLWCESQAAVLHTIWKARRAAMQATTAPRWRGIYSEST